MKDINGKDRPCINCKYYKNTWCMFFGEYRTYESTCSFWESK